MERDFSKNFRYFWKLNFAELRLNNRRNIQFFPSITFIILLYEVSVDFAIIEEKGGQLHLTATNRCTLSGPEKVQEERIAPEAQYQVSRTTIWNDYAEIDYSSKD